LLFLWGPLAVGFVCPPAVGRRSGLRAEEDDDDVRLGEIEDVGELLSIERRVKLAVAEKDVVFSSRSEVASVVAAGAGVRAFLVPSVADAQSLSASIERDSLLVTQRPPTPRDRFDVDFAIADSAKSFAKPTKTYAKVSKSREKFLAGREDSSSRKTQRRDVPLLVDWRDQKIVEEVYADDRFGGLVVLDDTLDDAVAFLETLFREKLGQGRLLQKKKPPPHGKKSPKSLILSRFSNELTRPSDIVDVLYILDLDADDAPFPEEDFFDDDDDDDEDDFQFLDEDEELVGFDDDDDNDEEDAALLEALLASDDDDEKPRRSRR